MGQEEKHREMEKLLRSLSLDRQRYLLELARAAQKAERFLDAGPPSDRKRGSP